jgi:exosortase
MNHSIEVNATKATNVQIMLYVLLAVMFIVAFFPALHSLVGTWYGSEENAYGLAILPASIYFIWRSKSKWLAQPARNTKLGAFAIIVSMGVYLFGQFAEISTLSYLSLVGAIWSIVLYLFGWAIFKCLIFPLSILLLMVPIPSQFYSMMTVPLQLFVSYVSAEIIETLGIPIYREGNVLHLTGRTFAVVQACSGLRSLMALITLCVIFGHLALRMNLLRTVLVLTAIPVALAVNIVRVVLMVGAYSAIKADLSYGTTHTIFGVLIFILAIIMVYAEIRVFSKWDTGNITQ